MPSLAFAEDELGLEFPALDDAPDLVPDCREPPPLCAVVLEELTPLDFPAGCGGADTALPAALELPLLASLAEAPAGAVAAAVVCC